MQTGSWMSFHNVELTGRICELQDAGVYKLNDLVAVVQYEYSWAVCTCPVVENAFRWSYYFLLLIVISYMIGFNL